MRVINYFGGPGLGKSMRAAELFARYKKDGIRCELALEAAKDFIYDGRGVTNQYLLFGEQLQRLKRLEGQTDYAITDCPLLMQIVYARENGQELLVPAIAHEWAKFENINYFIERRDSPVYGANEGRIHTEAQARDLDKQIKAVLIEFNCTFNII